MRFHKIRIAKIIMLLSRPGAERCGLLQEAEGGTENAGGPFYPSAVAGCPKGTGAADREANHEQL